MSRLRNLARQEYRYIFKQDCLTVSGRPTMHYYEWLESKVGGFLFDVQPTFLKKKVDNGSRFATMCRSVGNFIKGENK